jgi:hypothetical protein
MKIELAKNFGYRTAGDVEVRCRKATAGNIRFSFQIEYPKSVKWWNDLCHVGKGKVLSVLN